MSLHVFTVRNDHVENLADFFASRHIRLEWHGDAKKDAPAFRSDATLEMLHHLFAADGSFVTPHRNLAIREFAAEAKNLPIVDPEFARWVEFDPEFKTRRGSNVYRALMEAVKTGKVPFPFRVTAVA